LSWGQSLLQTGLSRGGNVNFGSHILDYPHELAFGPDHKLYVVDLNHNRIAVFNDRSEDHVSFIDFPHSWGFPKTVAVNKDGLIAVGFAGSAEAFVALILVNPQSGKSALHLDAGKPSQRVIEAEAQLGLTSASKPRAASMLYARYCTNCHENGNYGAPKRQSSDWDRFPHNIDVLLPIARAGKGAMIPAGGCSDCTDAEIRSLIAFMLPVWKEQTSSSGK
jgi:cytochrome c5